MERRARARERRLLTVPGGMPRIGGLPLGELQVDPEQHHLAVVGAEPGEGAAYGLGAVDVAGLVRPGAPAARRSAARPTSDAGGSGGAG